MKKEISDSAIRRMPRYHRYLKKMADRNIEYTSTRRLSELTGIHETQIRKDIALTGLKGVPRRGHSVIDLISSIESFLNWNDIDSAFLVGVGNIGSALLNFDNYQESGLKIIAAFDNDETKIGSVINGINVLDVEKLENLVMRMHINIGIITTPVKYAQNIANKMIKAGIIGIWNFTSQNLDVPDEIIVENVDLYRGLGVLSRRVAEKLNKI